MVKRLFHRFPRIFWQMCLGSLLFFLSFNLMLPELPDHLRKIGGAKHIGWIISSFSICALLARPFSGWVTDMLGRKWSMLGGTAFCIAAGFLYPISNVVWLFFAIRGLHGFSTGFAPTGFTAFTADVIPHKQRGEAMGWQGLFSNIGASAGYVLGAVIIAMLGTTGMYYVSSLFAVVAMWLFASLPETATKSKVKLTHKELFYIKAWKPALLMFLVCAPLGAILTIMPDYTVLSGFSNKGLYLSIYIAFSLLVRIFSGKLSDRHGRAVSTATGATFQLSALLLLFFFQNQWVFFLSAALYGIGQGFNAPGLFAWGSDVSTEKTRGQAFGTLFIAVEVGIIAGSLGAGYLLNQNPGLYQSVFGLGALCTFIALVTSYIFIKKGRQAPLVNS